MKELADLNSFYETLIYVLLRAANGDTMIPAFTHKNALVVNFDLPNNTSPSFTTTLN